MEGKFTDWVCYSNKVYMYFEMEWSVSNFSAFDFQNQIQSLIHECFEKRTEIPNVACLIAQLLKNKGRLKN